MTSRSGTVLHVIDTTGPGGAETVFLSLAEACIERGHRSVALIRGPGWVEEQLKKRGIPYLVRDSKGSLNFGFLKEMAKIIREEGVTQIQAHLLGSNVYASILGLTLRVPVVATFHGHVDISQAERLRSLKLGLIRFGSKHVVCVTEELKNSVNESTSGWAKLNPKVIANGIDTAPLERIPIDTQAISQGPIVLGCLGNVRPAKNYGLAVELMALLKSQNIPARLRIAGDDTNAAAADLKREVERRDLGDVVEFSGFIDDVPRFLSEIDVYLMTSSSEGHPLALTQALAAGRPAVSTLSGVERVIPKDLMFWAESHSAEALSEALQRVLRHEDLDSIASEAREFVKQHYSLAAMSTQYLELYEL
ncbi:MAG: glycosyltransferase family 4 protein [Pseudomonadota bacterium]